MIHPLTKALGFNSHHSCVHSSTSAHHKDDDKVSMSDEEEMNKNLKAIPWESEDNNRNKDGIYDGEDDLKELAEEEGSGEPVQQTLANILEIV